MSHDGILLGAMATPEGIAKAIGAERAGRIHPKAYNYHPQGYRLIVIPDRMPEQTEAGIYIPESRREDDQVQMGAGVVFAVGPMVGQNPERVPHPSGVGLASPDSFLYQHILWSQHAGAFLAMFYRRREEWNEVPILLTDRDVWIVDTSPSDEWRLEL